MTFVLIILSVILAIVLGTTITAVTIEIVKKYDIVLGLVILVLLYFTVVTTINLIEITKNSVECCG